MKEVSDIDKIFQQRLVNAEVPPPAQVWVNVERELRKKRKYRAIIWFWMGSLAFAGGWWWMSDRAGASSLSDNSKPGNIVESPAAAGRTEPQPHWATAEKNAVQSATITAAPANQTRSTLNTPKGIDHAGNRIAAVKPLSMPHPGTLAKSVAAPTTTANPTATSLTETKAALPSTGAPGLIAGDLYELPDAAYIDLNNTLKHPVPKTARIIRKKKDRKRCYDFNKNTSAWLLDFYAGPSLPQKLLSTTPDNLPYLNKRLNTERRDWAFNGGVRATYLFKRNFMLRSGLHYDHATEVFDFPILTRIDYNISYDPVTGKNDTTGQTPVYDHNKTFNRFGMLEVPLLAGAEVRSGNMGINVNAGMSLNLLFWKRGQIISPTTDKPAWFTPGKEELQLFRTHTGLSFVGSAQCFWHLHPRLRLYAEPYLRQVLKPISVASYPVEQRHRIWGLNLGVTLIVD